MSHPTSKPTPTWIDLETTDPAERKCCGDEFIIGSEQIHWHGDDRMEFFINACCQSCGTRFRRRFQFHGYPDEPYRDDLCSCAYPQVKFPRAEFNNSLTKVIVKRTCANCKRRLGNHNDSWEDAFYELTTIEKEG